MSNPPQQQLGHRMSPSAGQPESQAIVEGRDAPSSTNNNEGCIQTAGRPVRSSLRPLLWRFGDQVLLGCACATALVLMTVYCVRTSRWGADPIDLERQPHHELDYTIELNAANWVEWSQLPGIGPVLANRIVEERERNGLFSCVDDLNRVKGIGPKKIEAIRPYIRLQSAENNDY